MVIPADYDPWAQYFPQPIRTYWGQFLREIHHYEDTFWDDLTFPLTGQRLNSASGRVTYNYTEVTLDFATNARYPEEPIIMVAQLRHKGKVGVDLHPHLHWQQEEDNDPNWLFRWRKNIKGVPPGSWTNVVPATKRVFTYASGEIHQLTEWPVIDGSDLGISDIIDCIIFRDTANASGLFSGADPYTVAARAKEFDLHFEIDAPGSKEEYVK